MVGGHPDICLDGEVGIHPINADSPSVIILVGEVL
jgi:hypothetical protein